MMCNKSERGIYAPNYYQAFECIADRCRHSCCIGWEIGIDRETYEVYKQIGSISDTVRMCEDGPSFVLREDGRCPHLNERGLCNIILSYGESCLSEICRNHPRFFNILPRGRIEVGIGIVCEEACRLILEDATPFSLSKIEEVEEEAPADDCDFDALPQRTRMIAVIEKTEGFDSAIAVLKSEYGIFNPYPAEKWSERFLSLEILDPLWERDLRSMGGRLLRKGRACSDSFDAYYGRLLTYFIYRHVGMAESETALRARLAFSILSVEMIRALFEADETQTLETLVDWARRYSAEIEYSEDNTEELIFIFEGAFDATE